MIPMNETARKELGDYALRPFGLSHSSVSQAKPAAAIVEFCADLLARQHERNLAILEGREGELNKPLPRDL